MLITIKLSSYYDWTPMEGVPSDAEISGLKVKPSQGGSWLKRVVVDKPTYTQIGIPESEIANCIDYFERIGAPKTRARVIAWYLEDKIMPHHAHPSHWSSIQVHDDLEMEKALLTYFNLKAD